MEIASSFVITLGVGYVLLDESAKSTDTTHHTLRGLLSLCLCSLIYDVVFRNVKPRRHTPYAYRGVIGPGLCYLFLIPVAQIVSQSKTNNKLLKTYLRELEHSSDNKTIAYNELSHQMKPEGVQLAEVELTVPCVLSTCSVLHHFILLLYLGIRHGQRKVRVWHIVALLPLLLSCAVQFTHTTQHIGLSTALTLYSLCIFSGIAQWILALYLPGSFTLSEASIISQTLLVFLWRSRLWLFQVLQANLQEEDKLYTFTHVATLSTLTVFVLCFLLKRVMSSILFYILVAGTASCLSFPMLINALQSDFISWMFYYIKNDSGRTKTFFYWVLICIICVIIVWKVNEARTKRAKKDNGVSQSLGNGISKNIRKCFHLFALLTFAPLLHTRSIPILYCASTCGCIIFCMVECVRYLNVAPFGSIFREHLDIFRDKQDAGELIVTPIYLLVGFTLPLWLNGKPGLPLALFSGVISLGIGDSAAAFVGTKYGRLKWPNSQRSQEGTLAFILSCLVTIIVLFITSNVQFEGSFVHVIFAIVLTGLLEAFTSQIDNLVLPLFMFILLSSRQ